jgi:hypothetical protein
MTNQQAQANHVVTHQINAEKVAFWHAVLGSPTLATFLKALQRGYLHNIPDITAKMVQANLPVSVATARGHLDLNRQGTRSSKAQASNITGPSDSVDTPIEHSYAVPTRIVPLDAANHSDLTGKFPVVSKSGNQYVLVSVFNNYVYAVPMKSRNAAQYVEALETTLNHYKDLGHTVKLQRLDNETSQQVQRMLRQRNISIQYVPPNNHRANRAERAIRDVKNHLISMLATANPGCPLDLWDEFIPQLNITINLLRPFGPDHSKSAYYGVHKHHFDFAAHPMAPCGTAVLIHEAPQIRQSWAPHGLNGFYLGPALDHYRAYRIFVVASNQPRITDTVAWFLQPFKLPGCSPTEILQRSIDGFTSAISTLCDQNNISTQRRAEITPLMETISRLLQDMHVIMTADPPGLQRSSTEHPISSITPPVQCWIPLNRER